MALLKLNGVDVQVTDSEWEPVRLGEVVRSLNGAPRSTARVRKANYRFTSSLLSVPEAQLLRALVEGEGHALSFDDNSTPTGWLFSSGSVGPDQSDVSGAVKVTGRHGFGLKLVEESDTAVLSWNFQPSTASTLLLWTRELVGASLTWVHYICLTDPVRGYVQWRNGVLDSGSPVEAALSIPSTGTLVLSAAVAGDMEFDDVVLLPYAIPDAWAAALYAFHDTRPWPALPFVLAEDPRLPAGGLLCQGEAGPGKAMRLRSSVGEVFDFTLYGT